MQRKTTSVKIPRVTNTKDVERDVEFAHSELKKHIQKTYNPSPLKRINQVAGNLGEFIAILIYIIFRPLNIIAGGIVAIAMILLLRFL